MSSSGRQQNANGNRRTQAEGRPRYAWAKWPRCPECQSPRLRAYRTSRHGDSSITRHCKCQDCGARVYVVWE